jgi:hypothetical protein
MRAVESFGEKDPQTIKNTDKYANLAQLQIVAQIALDTTDRM